MIPIMLYSGISRRNAVQGERLALDGRHAQQSELVPNLVRTRVFPRKLAAVDELKRLAANYGKSLPQFVLRRTLNNPVVGTALVGFRTPAEVIENLGSLDWEISNADMAEIDVIFDRQGAITLPPG
jgi:myo-inositol catabolism protein IolS